MRKISSLLFSVLLLAAAGCGSDEPGTIEPPPDSPPPDVAGVWSGTEVVTTRGDDSSCNPDVVDGTRTGDIFTVSQTGAQIGILQHTPCAICQYTGTISGTGAFQATGTSGQVTVRVEGQVTEGHMTATRRPVGANCDRLSEFDLTRD